MINEPVPNAYFFVHKLTGSYYTRRTGDTLDADGVPMGHGGYKSIQEIADDVSKSMEAKWFDTDYVFVNDLPNNDSAFQIEGGKEKFRPATKKELEELVHLLNQ